MNESGSGSVIVNVNVTLRESGYGKKKRGDPSHLPGEYLLHMWLTASVKVKVKGLQLSWWVRVKRKQRVMDLMLLLGDKRT